jgi:hypothetical protein
MSCTSDVTHHLADREVICELCGASLFGDDANQQIVLLRTCFHAFHRDCFSDLETDQCPRCQSKVQGTCEISLEQFEGDDYPQILEKISNLCRAKMSKSNVVYRDQIYPFEISSELPIGEVFECISKKIGFDLGDCRIAFPYEAKIHHGPDLIDTSPVIRELGFSKTDLDEPYGSHEWVKIRSAKTVMVRDRFGRSFDVKYLENEDLRVFRYRLAVELSGLTDELRKRIGSYTEPNFTWGGPVNVNFFRIYMDHLAVSKDASFTGGDSLVLSLPSYYSYGWTDKSFLSLNQTIELLKQNRDELALESDQPSIRYPTFPGEQVESGPKIDRYVLIDLKLEERNDPMGYGYGWSSDKDRPKTIAKRVPDGELKERSLKILQELLSINSELGKGQIKYNRTNDKIDYTVNFDKSFDPVARLQAQNISTSLVGRLKESVALYERKIDSSSQWGPPRGISPPRAPQGFSLYEFGHNNEDLPRFLDTSSGLPYPKQTPELPWLVKRIEDIPERGELAVVDVGTARVSAAISFGVPLANPLESLTANCTFTTPGSAPVYLVKERIERAVSELSDDLYRLGLLLKKPRTISIDLRRRFLPPSAWSTVRDQEMIAFHNINDGIGGSNARWHNSPAKFTVSVLP